MAKLCAYCGNNPAILNSHILPRWVIKDALDGSVTGKLRATDNINRRLQDGEKLELLCTECEGAFSKLERPAADLYRAGGATHGAAYDADFVKFLVSILWRVGVSRLDDLRDTHPRFVPALEAANAAWKGFLDGTAPDVGNHPVWFTILNIDVAGQIRSAMAALGGVPPTVNRYFAGALGCEVVVYDHYGFAIVTAKTGAWFIAGVVEVPVRTGSSDIELLPAGGTFPARGHDIPAIVLASLGHHCRHCFEAAGEMRPRQRETIAEAYTKNAAKVATSKQHSALQEDIAMFGADAWVELPEPESE